MYQVQILKAAVVSTCYNKTHKLGLSVYEALLNCCRSVLLIIVYGVIPVKQFITRGVLPHSKIINEVGYTISISKIMGQLTETT